MAQYDEGTVLTCTHQGCGCRVVVRVACHCPGSDEGPGYQCACGAALVPVADGQG